MTLCYTLKGLMSLGDFDFYETSFFFFFCAYIQDKQDL